MKKQKIKPSRCRTGWTGCAYLCSVSTHKNDTFDCWNSLRFIGMSRSSSNSQRLPISNGLEKDVVYNG